MDLSWIPIFIGLIVTSWARLDEELNPSNLPVVPRCFHQPQEACPTADGQCSCKRLPNRRAVICCNVNKFLLTEGLACANVGTNGEVTELHIRNATLDVLNVTQATLRRLRSLSITDGQIGKIAGEFAKHTHISCLNLSSNAIGKIEDRSLVNLYNLSILDLSHNNLSEVPRFKKEGVVTLDISENKPLLCTNLLESMKRTNIHFKSDNETFCSSSKTFTWFNSTELVPLKQMENVYELGKECTSNCTCEHHRLDILPGKPPTFSILVNCAGQQFTSFPTLPPNTIALNISNNNITSLEPINDDVSYHNLRELYADNNQITSILELEGTKFINNFVGLSLTNNKLKSIPTYVFSNVFDGNPHTHQINLGGNKLQCDCNTAKVLKDWLLSKHKHILDSDQIYCDNMKSRVLDLDPSKLCQSKQDWTDYINYIIIAEVLLLVFLIAKVSYDYWVFKTAGYLPWPASKMPKLPCDWLCE